MLNKRFTFLTLGLAAAALVLWGVGGQASADLPTGAQLSSIGALEFGPDGTLFAGDNSGASIYAFQIAGASASGDREAVRDLDAKVAALLGAGPRDVFIKDMAVHPESRDVYLSVMRGQGTDARPALVRVDATGVVTNEPLGSLPYSKLQLDDAPGAPAEGARRDPRTLTITDLAVIDGELFVAGLSNEEFASVLRRAPIPFTGEAAATGLEIYHGAHGKYETHAPIYAFMPLDIGGEDHLLAGYLCTPLVTFPLADVRSEEKLRGKTVAELGFGNVPIDILGFERGGTDYVLMTNSRRGTMLMRADDIVAAQGAEGISSEVPGVVAGVEYLTSPLGHVLQIADYDQDNIVMLTRDPENGSLNLGTRGKRWL